MTKRTTLEIDPELLERAKRALGTPSMRETVEVALRRVAEEAETAHTERAQRQWEALTGIGDHVDLDVLSSEAMWR